MWFEKNIKEFINRKNYGTKFKVFLSETVFCFFNFVVKPDNYEIHKSLFFFSFFCFLQLVPKRKQFRGDFLSPLLQMAPNWLCNKRLAIEVRRGGTVSGNIGHNLQMGYPN